MARRGRELILEVTRLSPSEAYKHRHKAAVKWKGRMLFRVTLDVWHDCLAGNGNVTLSQLSYILASNPDALVRLIIGQHMPTKKHGKKHTDKQPQDKPSSILARIEYNPETEQLLLTFTSGGIYAYQGVSKRAYTNLMNAESRGSYFMKHIRDQYPTTCVFKPHKQ